MNRHDIPSPIIVAPSTSGVNSNPSDSPIPNSQTQLNTPRLLLALLKLKKLHQLTETPPDIQEQESIDGSCKIYIHSKNNRVLQHVQNQSPGPYTGVSPQSFEHIVNRLRELAQYQQSSSEPDTPTSIKVGLDNCTLFYIPEKPETLDQSEVLPISSQDSNPNIPNYNLNSQHTIKFIQNALLHSPRKIKNCNPNTVIQKSTDNQIILIHQEGFDNYIPEFSMDLENENLANPELTELLYKKLQELKLYQGHASIDDQNIRIITVEYSSNSTSGTVSVRDSSTPINRVESPGILSPNARYKLLTKLHAIEEDEEEKVIDIEGQTVLFVNDNVQLDSPQANVSEVSPLDGEVNSDLLQEVARKLRDIS